jgi:hypothetical protein
MGRAGTIRHPRFDLPNTFPQQLLCHAGKPIKRILLPSRKKDNRFSHDRGQGGFRGEVGAEGLEPPQNG